MDYTIDFRMNLKAVINRSSNVETLCCNRVPYAD